MRARRAFVLVAAALAASATTAADLGTLFYTPAERARLDAARRGEPATASSVQSEPASQAITGFVERSDGRGTVWIDGRPMRVSGPVSHRVFDPRAVRDYSHVGPEVKVEPESKTAH